LPQGVFHYLLAFLAVALATALRFAFDGFLSENNFASFFIATALVLFFAGAGPGALATVLSALSVSYFFLEPTNSFSIVVQGDVVRLVAFLSVGLLASAFMAGFRQRRRALIDEELRAAASLLRKEAHETLRQSERRYRTLFETSWDGIATVDMAGRIQDANPAFQRMLGYSLEELRNLTYRDITPPSWHEAEEAIVGNIVLPRGDSGEYEKEYICKDGSILPVCLRTWTVCDSTGKIIGMRAFVRDMTERKRAQQALEEASRRKDDFLATLSHELRNPLASISNSVAVLRRDAITRGETDREMEIISRIERQTSYLTRLVDDLLDVTRIARGKIELKTARTDLRDSLRNAFEAATPAIERERHRLECLWPDEPLLVNSDSVRLEQAFFNLLNNACKYTEPGGEISVSVERQGDQAVVTVRDNGVGIPPEMLPRIFDPFTQIDGMRGRSQGGIGIGLALVRSLVELHGGSVEAQSDGPGSGSAFIVRLPLLPTA